MAGGELSPADKQKTDLSLAEERFRFVSRKHISKFAVGFSVVFGFSALCVAFSLKDPIIVGIFVGASVLILAKSMSSTMPNPEREVVTDHPIVGLLQQTLEALRDYIQKK